MSATAWTVGRYVSSNAGGHGIDTVFGIPACTISSCNRGWKRAPAHVLVRHEQNAALPRRLRAGERMPRRRRS